MSEQTNTEGPDCPGCGAPAGLPPAGPCIAHATPYAVADIGLPGETVDGIRERAIVDRYYAREDMSDVGLPA